MQDKLLKKTPEFLMLNYSVFFFSSAGNGGIEVRCQSVIRHHLQVDPLESHVSIVSPPFRLMCIFYILNVNSIANSFFKNSN